MSANPDNKLVKIKVDKTERIEQEGVLYEIGQWFWVSDTDREWVDPESEDYDPSKAKKKGHGYYNEEEIEWLGCITEIGSNYVNVSRAGLEWGESMRVHLNEVDEWLRPEPDARAVIEGMVEDGKKRVINLMDKVKAITARLGMSPRLGLPQPQTEQSYALATLSGTDNVDAYETALVKAKDEELPALFEKIKSANKHISNWMKAETLPLKAMAGSMESVIGKIDDRIFNVSLYAGLTEQLSCAREGEPADYDEKLHLMQRKLYMDEECLLGYRTGGIDFESIGEFDEWISEKENFERIFPFPRCMVALQVRRETKERAWGGSLGQALINIQLAELDHTTYLYIRNGEQLHWMGCDLDFGKLIFPKKNAFNPGQETMLRDRDRKVITRSDYETRKKKEQKRKKKFKQWRKENPFKKWKAAKQAETPRENWPWWKNEWEKENPHYKYSGDCFNHKEWAPFDSTNVFYDDAMEKIGKRVKYYNRVALIIQGLFDRSDVLHPHPPARTWTPEGFMDAIELVYDGDRCLYAGDPPSFEDYVAKCNESIDADSVLIGQDEFWQRREAVIENSRKARNWRRSEYDRDCEFFKPYGNSGPGWMARPARWQKRAKKAIFIWNRSRQTYDRWAGEGKRHGDPIRTTLTVPVEHLFNVSAYKPGDYKQFFADPRTRQRYLRWAPALLSAEEYHAGNLKAQEPVE